MIFSQHVHLHMTVMLFGGNILTQAIKNTKLKEYNILNTIIIQ